MKKTVLTIIALTMLSIGAKAQNVNIPDANFKAYLVSNTNINTNNDGEIQVSEATAYTGQIACSNKGITDMTGLEAFTNITALQCIQNSFSTLNVSQNTALTLLNCGNSNVTTLDLSQNIALKTLICDNASLNTLDVSQNINLINIKVLNNNLTSLDVSQNTSLLYLWLNDNNLTSLDISQNTNLVRLECTSNNLTELNLKNISPTVLVDFIATSNPNLTCIEVDDVADATTNWTNIDATASFSLDCGSTSSVNQSELSQYISIYPNPVVSEIYIHSDLTIQSINIIDALGKNVELNLTSHTSIDLSGLSNGVYFIKVLTDKGLISKKFIKY